MYLQRRKYLPNLKSCEVKWCYVSEVNYGEWTTTHSFTLSNSRITKKKKKNTTNWVYITYCRLPANHDCGAGPVKTPQRAACVKIMPLYTVDKQKRHPNNTQAYRNAVSQPKQKVATFNVRINSPYSIPLSPHTLCTATAARFNCSHWFWEIVFY